MNNHPPPLGHIVASDKPNTSQDIRLDYVARTLASNIFNGLLLLSALALSGYLYNLYSVSSVEHDRRQAKPARKNAHHAPLLVGIPQTNAQLMVEVSNANKIAQQITLPWGRLFGALESAAYQPTPLLQVHPDSENRVLTLVGETQNFIELDVYLKRLQNETLFSSVYLVDYEMSQQELPRPLRFTLRATW